MTTLEQANQSALAAADSADLKTLAQALRARAICVQDLKRMPPTEALLRQIAASIQYGESIERGLLSMKQRIATERMRLSQLESGLSMGAGFSHTSNISYRG